MELKLTTAEVGIILSKMKNWINNHKTSIIISLIGVLLGFLYWYFIGCSSGNCAITSVWYRTMLYGGVLGWLGGDFVKEKINNSTNKKTKN